MRYQQLEEASQFCRGGRQALWLLWAGEQLQVALALSHQSLEQRGIQPMQILQGVDYSEGGPYIQMKSAMSQGSKIHKQNSVLGLLERNGRVNGDSGTPASAFGIHYGDDRGATGGGAAFAAGGGKPRHRFNQGFGGCAAFQKFPSPCTHRGHDGGWVIHFTDGKNCDIAGVRVDYFNGANGSLRIVRVNIQYYYF